MSVNRACKRRAVVLPRGWGAMLREAIPVGCCARAPAARSQSMSRRVMNCRSPSGVASRHGVSGGGLKFSGLASERQLYSGLYEPGRRRADHLTESRTGDLAIDRRRPEELRVVERVESFQPELQRFPFYQTDRFQKAIAEVRHSRPLEHCPIRGSRLAHRR